jgi:hypothetical protein
LLGRPNVRIVFCIALEQPTNVNHVAFHSFCAYRVSYHTTASGG